MAGDENARAVFEQYWLHARHVENQRLHITNFLLAIFAALLAFMSVTEIPWHLSAFGLLISLFGLLMVHALRVPFLRYSRTAEVIMAVELGMDRYRRFFISKSENKKGPKAVIDKLWGVHRFYVLLFTTSMAGWCALTAQSLKAELWVNGTVFAGVAIGMPIIYYLLFGTRENAVGEEIRKLQESLQSLSGEVKK